MKQSIDFSGFVDAFMAHNRFDQFGYEGLKVLFDYLEDLEDSSGEEIELDVIALCCEWSLLDLSGINRMYGDEFGDMGEAIRFLERNTTVLIVDSDSVLVREF